MIRRFFALTIIALLIAPTPKLFLYRYGNFALISPDWDTHKGIGFRWEAWHYRVRLMFWKINVVIKYKSEAKSE